MAFPQGIQWFSFNFFIFVHDVSLISTLFIFTSFSVLKMVDFGVETLLCAILSMGIFNSLGYFVADFVLHC